MCRFILIAILVLMQTACTNTGQANNRIKSYKIHGKAYVKLNDIAKYYGMKLTTSGKKFSIYSKWTKINCTDNSRKASINNVQCTFSHAASKISSSPAISSLDFLYYIDPIIRKNSIPAKKVYHVLIDPGHGGKDQGTSGKSNKEKTIVLNLASKCATILRKYGYKVSFTRTSDKTLSLAQRTALAKRLKPDIFVSLHCNSASSSVTGIETFALALAGGSSSNGSKRKTGTYANKFNKENIKLAYEIQKNLVSTTKAKDRGVKHAQFYVLNHATCPAVLVEAGFLSNKYEEKKLASSYYQNQLATGIVRGIVAYTKAVSRKK